MPSKELTLEEILASNPHISEAQIAKIAAMLKQRRELGNKRSKYRLVPPYTHRHVAISGERSEDPRTVTKHRR